LGTTLEGVDLRARLQAAARNDPEVVFVRRHLCHKLAIEDDLIARTAGVKVHVGGRNVCTNCLRTGSGSPAGATFKRVATVNFATTTAWNTASNGIADNDLSRWTPVIFIVFKRVVAFSEALIGPNTERWAGASLVTALADKKRIRSIVFIQQKPDCAAVWALRAWVAHYWAKTSRAIHLSRFDLPEDRTDSPACSTGRAIVPSANSPVANLRGVRLWAENCCRTIRFALASKIRAADQESQWTAVPAVAECIFERLKIGLARRIRTAYDSCAGAICLRSFRTKRKVQAVEIHDGNPNLTVALELFAWNEIDNLWLAGIAAACKGQLAAHLESSSFSNLREMSCIMPTCFSSFAADRT